MELDIFGAFLRERRMELGLTQADLAKKLNVTDKAVSRWERGKGYPEVTLLEPLAKALELTLVELMQSRRLPSGTVTREDAEAAAANILEIAQPKPPERPRWFPAAMGLLTFIGVMSVLVFLCLQFLSYPTYLLSRWNPDFTVNDSYTDRDLFADQSWTSMEHTAYADGRPVSTTRFWNGLAGKYTITHTAAGTQQTITGSSGSGSYFNYRDSGDHFRVSGSYQVDGGQVEWYSLYHQATPEGSPELVKRIEIDYLANLHLGLYKETLTDAQGNVLGWRQYEWENSRTSQSRDYDAQGSLLGCTEYTYPNGERHTAVYSASGELVERTESRLNWQGQVTQRKIYDASGALTGQEVYHHRFWERFGDILGGALLIVFTGVSGFLATEIYGELKNRCRYS